MQRGFKVYQKNCSSCHGMKLLSFRNLGEVGGPQPRRKRRVDAFRPQFRRVGEGLVGILLGKQVDKGGKIAALVERRIEQEDLVDALLPREAIQPRAALSASSP